MRKKPSSINDDRHIKHFDAVTSMALYNFMVLKCEEMGIQPQIIHAAGLVHWSKRQTKPEGLTVS